MPRPRREQTGRALRLSREGAGRDLDMAPAIAAEVERVSGAASVSSMLVDRYARQALAFAYHVLGNREDAEDVAQEALIRALFGRARFRQQAAFSTWLYRVVHNLCIDRLRAEKRAALTSLDGHDYRLNGDAHRDFDRVLEVAALRQALDSLPPLMRSIIILRDVEGLTYDELKSVFRVPLGTVKSRLNHARRLLRQALEAQK